jgi:hypothetical protein
VLYRGLADRNCMIYSLQPRKFNYQCRRTSADSLRSQGFANCTVRVNSDDLCGECTWNDEVHVESYSQSPNSRSCLDLFFQLSRFSFWMGKGDCRAPALYYFSEVSIFGQIVHHLLVGMNLYFPQLYWTPRAFVLA